MPSDHLAWCIINQTTNYKEAAPWPESDMLGGLMSGGQIGGKRPSRSFE
jgi:hypothetical protein